MELVTIKYLDHIFKNNENKTRETFPLLINKLICESKSKNSRFYMPSGDDISLRGFDGIIENNESDHRYVAKGNSIFEIGTGENSIKKIEDDFSNRNDNEKNMYKERYTYYAISSRIINPIEKINCQNLLKEKSKFKDFIILDLADIQSWLNEHVNILIWLLHEYGENLNIYDIRILEDEFKRILIDKNNEKSSLLYTVSNEENERKLIDISCKENKIISIKSPYGKEHSFYFCITSFYNSNNDSLKNRVLIVKNQCALDFINENCKNKIVVVNFNSRDNSLNSNNTYIFLDSFNGQENVIELNYNNKNKLIEKIQSLNYSFDKANYLAFNSGYNVITLRRLLSNSPTIHNPAWKNNNDKIKLIPLLLLGEINFENEKSIILLKLFDIAKIDEFINILNEWVEIKDSPLFKYDSRYKFSSRKEGFECISIDLFTDCLKNLESMISDSLKNTEKLKMIDSNIFNNIIDGFILMSNLNEKK